MSAQEASFMGGVEVPPSKSLTDKVAIERCPAPDMVYIPLSQHIGAPAKPVVKPGDKVTMGQVIGEAGGFVSTNIHSSVSGMVMKLESRYMPNGMISQCVVIKNDGQDTPCEDMKPRKEEDITPDLIRQVLRDRGIAGMGGATFPTAVKYAPVKEGHRPIDTVLLNGIECEPFVTADHRTLLEYSDEIIQGLKYFMLASGASKGIIGIEDNKPDAIALMQKKVASEANIEVCVCKEKYPQGSEKHLIFAATGRTVPDRGLPADVGVIVDNVGTAVAACRAVKNNVPLYERVVTISGDGVKKPGNYIVRLGTLYSDAVEKPPASGRRSRQDHFRRDDDGLCRQLPGLSDHERLQRPADLQLQISFRPIRGTGSLRPLRSLRRCLPHETGTDRNRPGCEKAELG